MTVDAPQIAFGDVSLRSNMLHIGNNTYPVKAVTGLQMWEDNSIRQAGSLRWWRVFWSGLSTFIIFLIVQWLRDVGHPTDAALVLFVPLLGIGGLFMLAFLLVAVLSGLKSAATHPLKTNGPKSRLTISFANGGSYTLAGKLDDLIPVKDAIANAMATH